MDTRRHAPLGRARVHLVQGVSGRAPRADHRRGRRQLADIYTSDHAHPSRSGQFRWLLSTSLAAAVGLLAIVSAIFGSTDTQDAAPRSPSARPGGLRWAIPKSDKLLVPSGVPSGAMAVAFAIPASVPQRRDGREFIFEKTYHRFEARLASVSKAQAEGIPRLDPIALYANTTPLGRTAGVGESRREAVAKAIELRGGTIANEDGQELDPQEVAELVARLLATGQPTAMRPGSENAWRSTPGERLAEGSLQTASEPSLPNTSILQKSVFEADGTADYAARVHSSSLYASLYYTAGQLDIPPELILQVLKIHAYATDFSQSVRAGDAFEFFFDAREEGKGANSRLGALLATAIVSNRETRRFYRFGTPDGAVDYYDEHGSTSRKFLMRQPVGCADARVASGFGTRMHPLLQVLRPHTGVDWACAAGTPIMAAGSGLVEEAGSRGEYGNYIRIRHGNGYKTAYGHLSGFAAGLSEGVRVRQGQIIGFVGTSGFTSGPHLHFEVLIKNSHDAGYRHIDPLSMDVPQERELAGKDLVDFKKERDRIDKLMRRDPISTRVAIGTLRP